MIQSSLIDPVLFIRWREECTAADVEEINAIIQRTNRNIGKRMIYIAVIPVGVPPPSPEARAALREGSNQAVEFCSSVHIVIEGEGMRRALIRSVSAGLLLATRGSFHIHSGMREALTIARKATDFDLEKMLAEARKQDLFEME
jgi:hypothetical protein